MKRQRPAVKRTKEMPESHVTTTRAGSVFEKRCDGTGGRCQACRDDFFFDQVCDEVEGRYESRTKQ
jgi:hypothetical protein